MPKHQETVILPYPKEFLYSIVRDVSSYPKFLPWCGGAVIVDESKDGFTADLQVGFGFLKETFRSKVVTAPDKIEVHYVKGPFKYLDNSWEFETVTENSTKVHFLVDFAFESPLLESMMEGFFTHAFSKMMAAFEERARDLYSSS
jgi:coenzyme Q-binding protein COQ10